MPRSVLFNVAAAGLLLASACGYPNASQTQRAGGVAPAQHSSPAIRPDPEVGPLTLEEARHAADPLSLTPLPSSAAPPLPLLRAGARRSAPAAISSGKSQVREVFGYAPYWALSHESEWDYSVLSTIAYFALAPNSDGTFAQSGGGWTGWNSADLTDMINRAHMAGDKVVLTLKSSDDGTINLVDSTNRQALINNTIAAIQAKNLDGVNVDFEATESTNFPDLQAGLTTLAADMSQQVHARWASAEVSFATYAGSASWDGGVFNIGQIAPSVDALFVMAYDSVFSNMPGQAGPNAPMNGWTYNDTIDVQQYLTKAPASKIILGVPYYGYRWSTTNGGAHAPTVSGATAEGFAAAVTDLSCAHPSLSQGWDGTGQSPWASWWSPPSNDPCGDNLGRPQELYYDDASSLGIKYDLINQQNLRGAGIWALGYDSGRTELWGALHTHFSCPVTTNLPVSEATTEFNLILTAGTCSVAYYDIQQYDSTSNQGWFGIPSVASAGGSATVTVEGYPGHTYQLQARAHTTSGLVSSWTTVSTAVAPTATYSHPFKGLYTLDAFGGVSSDASPPLAMSAYWPGWRIARAVKAQPGANAPQSGFVLDGYGGLHPYGVAGLTETPDGSSHYWGFDIARDIAFMPDGTGGFVLDGYGGLHPFHVNGSTAALAAQGNAYWSGWDIARKVAIFPDGTGGYVLDAYGGVHPFGINGPAPAGLGSIAVTSYWPGWLIARDLVLVPGNSGHSGYVLDGFGGLHPFHPTGDGSTMPAPITPGSYWSGWDIARGVVFLPGSATSGYTLDGYGGLHPFGGAAAITQHPYWTGTPVGVAVTGS